MLYTEELPYGQTYELRHNGTVGVHVFIERSIAVVFSNIKSFSNVLLMGGLSGKYFRIKEEDLHTLYGSEYYDYETLLEIAEGLDLLISKSNLQ